MTDTFSGEVSALSVLRQHAPLLLVLWLAEITGSFEASMILATLKYLIAEFGSASQAGWMVTAYLLVGSASAAIFGRLGDMYGRKKLIIFVLAIGLAGSLLSPVSSSFALLLLGRSLQGVTGAIFPLCIGLVRENLPAKQVPTGIGLVLSGAAVGTAAGMLLGGFLADRFGWHTVFAASAAYCAVSIVGILWIVPTRLGEAVARRFDWQSAVLFVPGISAVLFGISTSARNGWSWQGGLSAAGGAVLLAIWIYRSLTIADPLLNLRLFRLRPVVVTNGVAGLMAMGAFQASLLFSIILQNPRWTGAGLGITALQLGLAALPATGMGVIGGPLAGHMITRHGGRTTILAAGMVILAGWLSGFAFNDSVIAVVLAWCILNVGTACMMGATSIVLAEVVPPERTSEASGMIVVVRGVAQGVGAMLVTTLLASESVRDRISGAEFPTAGALSLTIAVMAALGVGAVVIALALPRRGQLAKAAT